MGKLNVLNLIRLLCGETQHKNKKGKGKGCFGKKNHSIPKGHVPAPPKRKHVSNRKQIKRLRALKNVKVEV